MFFDSKEIYDRMDKMRLERGWSIYRLAKMANISVNSLYSWRDRQSSPTLYMIESIASAFDISPINVLLSLEEQENFDNEEKELLKHWNALSADQRKTLMNMLK